ncbi:MAG: hypothetical protein ACXV2F_07745 [Halobacteriota archaeon]
MQRTEKRTLCDCFSKGDLTFVIDGKQETGLGSVEFILTQEIIKEGESPTRGYHAVDGIFYSKDAETATKLLEQLDNAEIRTIRGVFEDRNSGKEGEVTLEGVLFPDIIIGWSGWAFTANSGRCPGQ